MSVTQRTAAPQPATTLLIGEPGRGKTTRIRETLLLAAEDGDCGIIALDQEGDIYNAAAALGRTHTVHRLAFLDDDNARGGDGARYGWNPLATCRDDRAARLLAHTWVSNTEGVGTGGTADRRDPTAAHTALIAAAALRLTSAAAARGAVATLPELTALVTLRDRFTVLNDPCVRTIVLDDAPVTAGAIPAGTARRRSAGAPDAGRAHLLTGVRPPLGWSSNDHNDRVNALPCRWPRRRVGGHDPRPRARGGQFPRDSHQHRSRCGHQRH